jgi:hypothetical protein
MIFGFEFCMFLAILCKLDQFRTQKSWKWLEITPWYLMLL